MDLYSGTTSAYFIKSGKKPSASDLLKIKVNGPVIERCSVFNITVEISSYPLLVLLDRLFMRVVSSDLLVGFRYIVAGLFGMLLM